MVDRPGGKLQAKLYPEPSRSSEENPPEAQGSQFHRLVAHGPDGVTVQMTEVAVAAAAAPSESSRHRLMWVRNASRRFLKKIERINT